MYLPYLKTELVGATPNGFSSPEFEGFDLTGLHRNKAPRRKQRGIKCALQTAGFQPAFAPRGEELNPEEIKIIFSSCL